MSRRRAPVNLLRFGMFVPCTGVTRKAPAALAVVCLVTANLMAAQSQASALESRPLTLPALLERVRTQHPLVGASDSRLAAARGARRAAGVFPNPVLGLGVENAALPGRGPVVGMDREVMATAALPLEFLYQRGARVRRANEEVAAARADALADRQRIALDAIRAYYRAALARVELTTAEDLAAWLDSLVTYNQNRVAEGVTGEAELIRTELERDRASADLTIKQTMAIQAQADVAAFYGDSTAAVPASAPVAPSDLPLESLAASGSTPRGIRPEVQSARARLAAAGAGIGVAQSMLIRDLSAMAGLKRSVGTTTLLAGVSLPLPLVDQNRGEVARARAERDLATFELAATERRVHAELVGAIEAARLLTERVHVLRGPGDTAAPGERVRYLARADEARRIALGAYREGAVPLLSVLDAARTWGDARMTYYRTLYSQHESVMILLAAEGRDLFSEVPALVGATASRGIPR